MNVRASLLKGGLKLGSGQLVNQASSFTKNLILARLIGPADFGVAAIFAMTFSLLEMISSLSAQVLLVQAEEGDDPRFENTIHFVHAVRGIMNAAIMFVLAAPISHLFGAPRAKLAFQFLALVPLIRGFYHLDINRFQRTMRFGPSVLVDTGSNLLVALIALPVVLWLRSYWAMLWLLIAQAVCYLIASHIVAERRYSWAWDRSYTKRMFRFGWPLLINGLLMFAIFDGDRFIIGSAHRLFPNANFTLSDLGVYSVAFALAQAPMGFIANLCMSLFLPLLSRVQDLPRQFEQRYLACIHIVSLVAALASVGFIVAGGKLVAVIYGQKYAAAGLFVGWLSAMWAVRIVRVAPILAALAHGDTRNSMLSNLARTSALFGIFLVASTGASLVWIPICDFIGELLALVVCLWRLQVRHGLPATLSFKPYAVFFGGAALAALIVAAGVRNLSLLPTLSLTACLCLLQVMVMCWTFARLREELSPLLVKLRSSFLPAKIAF